MADHSRFVRPLFGRVRETIFALCTVWLLIQNCVLLAFLPWKRLPEMSSMAWAVFKAAALVLGPLWVLGSAAVLGWAFTTWLARDAAAGDPEWETHHGRAR